MLLEYKQMRGELPLATRTQGVSGLLVNDTFIRRETESGQNESEQKEWRTLRGRSNQDKSSSVTSVPAHLTYP
jgi:hypothetical protein